MVLKNNRKRHYWCQRSYTGYKSDGRRWVALEPAIVYFHKKYWFNIIAMIRDNGISLLLQYGWPTIWMKKHWSILITICKIFTDKEKRLSWTLREYERHKRKMNYSDDLDYILKRTCQIALRLD